MAVVAPRSMGPEYQLLLACSKSSPTETDESNLRRALDEPLDWDLLMGLSEWHRLSPLLFAHFRVTGLEDAIPQQMMRALHSAYYTTVARTALYEHELRSVLEVLNRSRIPVILLKGSALIHNVYEDPGFRSMNDLDLLVPEDRIQEAERVLRGDGWSEVPGPDNAEMRRSFRHVPALQNRAGTVSVELHRELVSPPLHWNVERVWERSSSSAHVGPAQVPSPEDLLAHVSLHFFMDRHEVRPGALRQLVDIAEIIRRYPKLDWKLLRVEAERSGSAGAFACGLWAAEQLLSVQIPQWATDVVASDEKGAAAFLRQRVLGRTAWPLRELVRPDETYTSLRAIRNSLRRLFPSRRYLERKYSGVSRFQSLRLAHHLRDLVVRWRASLSQPTVVREALIADRWLHSLVSQSPPLPDR